MMKSFILGLVFNLIRLTENHLINCVSKKNGDFNNFIVNDRYLWTVNTDDVKRCASECLKDEKCVVFFYSGTGECRTHSAVVSVHSDMVPTPNWIYYVTCRGEAYIGTSCATNNECTTTNSECRDDVCKCIPGYSFHEQHRTCSATCDNYGGGYTETKHHFIMGFNSLTMYGVDFNSCYEACNSATGFTCKTFEYRYTSGACYLQPATKLDAGAGNWRESDIDFHYQMDCI